MNDGEPHIPVLLDAIVDAVGTIAGTWVDATFGAGGYTRRLLGEGADAVIAGDDVDIIVCNAGINTFGDLELVNGVERMGGANEQAAEVAAADSQVLEMRPRHGRFQFGQFEIAAADAQQRKMVKPRDGINRLLGRRFDSDRLNRSHANRKRLGHTRLQPLR